MIGVCDHRQLPWGCVAAVWLMQLLKERLLNYVQLSRIPGSDYYLVRSTCMLPHASCC